MSGRKKAVTKWSIYWIIVLCAYIAASIVFKNFIMYLPVPILAGLNFLLCVLLNRPFCGIKNEKAKRIIRIIISTLSVCLTALLCSIIIINGFDYNNKYIESLDYSVFTYKSEIEYNRTDGVYTVRATDDKLRILQLTDVHLCGSITTVKTDRKAIDTCYDLIKKSKPDLIIVTGDIVYPIPIQTFSQNNLKPIYQFCSFMNHVGIPWIMVYGNHDTEVIASYDEKTFDGIFQYFKEDPDCPMLYADKQPDVYGRYNQYLRIENSIGELTKLIFLVDSNDYVEVSAEINDYDSVHKDQIEWYSETIDSVSKETEKTVKSFVFMHIPFEEFADAKAELDVGGDAVYLFGENGEKVSHPKNNSGFFDAILDKNSTEAVFVGHDHLNNMGIKYKGIDLVYSKSIDYIAYPGISKMTEQRGATLITIANDGGYEIEQIDYEK